MINTASTIVASIVSALLSQMPYITLQLILTITLQAGLDYLLSDEMRKEREEKGRNNGCVKQNKNNDN